jgi:hypothetical protein
MVLSFMEAGKYGSSSASFCLTASAVASALAPVAS